MQERALHTFKPGDSFYYFTVERKIGEGYNGTIYEIVHRQTGDRFALKTMWAADCVDPSKTARALASAKGHYRIDHKNVVKVFDLNCERATASCGCAPSCSAAARSRS
jgi:hypothetical protein